MKKLFFIALSVLAVQLTSPAHAQFAKPEDAVKYRKSVFTVLATHFGGIGAVVTGKAPYDKATAIKNAEIVAALASLNSKAFPTGSKDNSKAKDAVWSKTENFQSCFTNFQKEADDLLAAAKKGEEAALKAPFLAVAKTVKECHETFKD